MTNSPTLHYKRLNTRTSGLQTAQPMDHLSIVGRGNRLFSKPSRPTLGPTLSPAQRVLGALYPGVKLSDPEADHSPPSSAEVKKECSYYIPPYAFMACTRKTLIFALICLPLTMENINTGICGRHT